MKKISVGMRFLAAIMVIAIILTVSFIPNSVVKATIQNPPGINTDKNVNINNLQSDWNTEANGKGMFKHVTTPVVDGVKLDVDEAYFGGAGTSAANYAAKGFVDVMLTPFNAKGDGVNDDTAEIQKALDYARTNQYAVYFPVGTYKVTNTLRIYSGITERSNFSLICNKNENPNVMVGSRGTDGVTMGGATIKLANSAAGYSSATNAKAVVQYRQPRIVNNSPVFTIKWSEHASNLEGLHRLENLTIDVGDNNPGAIALHYATAEGGILQDIIINAEGGLCGILGGSGSGGGWTNVTVNGGKIGIDTRIDTITTPQMQNITLNDQNKIAWYAGASGTGIVTGLKIIAKYTGPAIVQMKRGQPYFGTLSLIDVSIDYQGSTASCAIAGTSVQTQLDDSDPNSATIHAVEDIQEGLYIQNLYVKNCNNFVRTVCSTGSTAWMWLKEYAYGQSQSWSGATFTAPSKVGGVDYATEYDLAGNKVAATPPPTLISKHGWAMIDSPNFGWTRVKPSSIPAIANVKTSYGAAGDGVTDDTDELQAAINENEYVFLPKGYYAIKNTLMLKSNTKLFGVAAAYSTIIAHPTFVNNTAYPAFDAGSNKPLVDTPDTNSADVVICDLGISPPSEMSTVQANTCMPIYSLRWRVGGTSLLHSVLLEPIRYYGFGGVGSGAKGGNDWNKPLLQITGNGGGRMYYLFMALFGVSVPDSMNMMTVKSKTAGSAAMKFYSLEAQYIESDTIIDINNAPDVTIYGLKSECTATLIKVTSSERFNLYGISGLATAPYNNDPTLHVMPGTVENWRKGNLVSINTTTNFRVVNINDQIKADFEDIWMYWLNRYDLYYPIRVDGANPAPFDSTERPVLFRKGTP